MTVPQFENLVENFLIVPYNFVHVSVEVFISIYTLSIKNL